MKGVTRQNKKLLDNHQSSQISQEKMSLHPTTLAKAEWGIQTSLLQGCNEAIQCLHWVYVREDQMRVGISSLLDRNKEAFPFPHQKGVKGNLVESHSIYYYPVVMRPLLSPCQWRPHENQELPIFLAIKMNFPYLWVSTETISTTFCNNGSIFLFPLFPARAISKKAS